jgi:hypothetical protein
VSYESCASPGETVQTGCNACLRADTRDVFVAIEIYFVARNFTPQNLRRSLTYSLDSATRALQNASKYCGHVLLAPDTGRAEKGHFRG